MSPERKSRVISKREKEIKAVHESGHALAALLIPGADPVHKISIIPRGMGIGGYTLQIPEEDRTLISKQDLLDRITVLLGGRVAEEVYFKEITSGASDDLEKATHFAQTMVCELGMSRRLGNLTFGKKDQQIFLGRDLMRERDYSEQTAIIIDEEVRQIVDGCYRRAKELIQNNQDKLKNLSAQLLEKEVLYIEEIKKITGINGHSSGESKPPESKS